MAEEEFVDEEEILRERLGGPAPDRARLLVGTSGWSYRDWEGSFYAPGTRPEGYLASYASSFATVEVDSTFYAIPRREAVEAWARRSPPGFVFAAKFPKDVTHAPGGLLDGGALAARFVERMALLGDKLGPLLLQFPQSFRPERREDLAAFLAALPGGFRYAVELRHSAWVGEETFDLLGGLGMAWAAGVGPLNPPVRPVTADFAYLRWLGDRSIESFSQVLIDRKGELHDWAAWIEAQREKLREIYGYFNNHYAGHGPASARTLLRLLGEEPPPAPAERQGDLFG